MHKIAILQRGNRVDLRVEQFCTDTMHMFAKYKNGNVWCVLQITYKDKYEVYYLGKFAETFKAL